MARWLALLLALSALPASIAGAQAAPPQGAWLRYRFEQRMRSQSGQYVGYDEITAANARYEIVEVLPDQVTLRGRYAWAYSSSDHYRSGAEDRTVHFGLPDRRYREARTDVSDLDTQDGTTLATWIWIPPGLLPGTQVPIFDRAFEIVGPTTVVASGANRPAIHVRAAYPDRRDDDYGSLTTAITDEYWFDSTTGMFLREHHVESASGTLEGLSAGFTLETTIELVDASYAPAASPPTEPSYTTPPSVSVHAQPATVPRTYESRMAGRPRVGELFQLVLPCGGGVVVLFLLGFLVLRGRRPATYRTAQGVVYTVEELATPPLPGLGPLSATFDWFLPHMITVARAWQQRVAYAKAANGAVLGVAIDDTPAAIATIFAPDSEVCETLRATLGRPELFSETRHPALASVRAADPTVAKEAYNLYETFEVLELSARPDELGYDTEVVDPLTPEHLQEVEQLLDAVYGPGCGPWLRASLSYGDVGWVAREGGRVVGVALATLVGDRARLHTLTVAKEHRGKHLGTALYRARLRGLFDLGVTRVLTEVATWNLAALDLAREHGFSKTGLMYVESARPVRLERRFVRR